MRSERDSRRALIKYLAASPLLAALGTAACEGKEEQDDDASERTGTLGEPDQELGEIVAKADDALDVFDLRVTAQATLPPAHYGYIATGSDGDVTLRANRSGFSHWQLRERRLVNVENVDMSTSILGSAMETPIIIHPTGSQKAFHPDGELATARAAKSQKHVMALSTVSTTSVEEVAAARGEPVWYQLYATSKWEITERLLKRAEDAGSPVVYLTTDLVRSSNRVSLSRFIKRDRRDCTQCHGNDSYGSRNTQFARKPMFDGITVESGAFDTPAMDWAFVDKLRSATNMKVVVKGITTAEDAQQCLSHGVDGIVVSNHGGRAVESGRATIESLPEIVRIVQRRIPVIFDSGIRRGTDVFKALALGADAVGVGRPYLWGLGAFGQEGVERVLRILRAELRTTMSLTGKRTLRDIDANAVVRSS